MRIRDLVILLVFLAPMLLSGCVTAGIAAEDAVIRAKDRVAPALVHIRPVKQVYAGGRSENLPVIGSGFLISPDGYVVTNEHVAGDARYVKCVLYDKEEVNAQVIGTDRYTDIAVLKLEGGRENLPSVRMGDSSKAKVGQTVLALGSPHGLERSVSVGIISVTDRNLGDEEIAPYNNWLQTDAAINQGNSGGPLVNLHGEVVGINTRKLGGADNLGFAIPIDTAKEVVAQLIEKGEVPRSTLGVSLQAMTSVTDDPAQQGVIVSDIDPLAPAAETSLRPGDRLLSVNDTPVHARFPEDLPPVRKMLAELPVGQPAALRVARGDTEETVSVAPIAMSDLRGEEAELADWAFTVAEVTPMAARRAQLPARQGVLVSGTQVGGIAAVAGLRNGDIILTVDGAPVADLDSFRQIYDELLATHKSLVLMDVKQGAFTRFVLVKQESASAEGAAAVDQPAGPDQESQVNVE